MLSCECGALYQQKHYLLFHKYLFLIQYTKPVEHIPLDVIYDWYPAVYIFHLVSFM